jgi:hypothetical protein
MRVEYVILFPIIIIIIIIVTVFLGSKFSPSLNDNVNLGVPSSNIRNCISFLQHAQIALAPDVQ